MEKTRRCRGRIGRHLSLVALLLTAGPALPMPTFAAEPKPPAPPPPMVLAEPWLLQSTVLAPQPGEVISSAEFTPKQWHPTRVPSTALSTLIRRGVHPDMRVGLNNFKIPDASDEFNRKHDLARFSHLPQQRNPWRDPYWFRSEFTLPQLPPGTQTWLHLDAINYRADVWLNGRQVGDREEIAGMFQRFALNISRAARPGQNVLAVKVFPVDHPGEPSTQFEVLGRERSYQTELMLDVTMVTCVGYDCMPTVRDRHLGLWQKAWIDFTGPVDLRHPFVVSHLPLPRTDQARLSISAELFNASTAQQQGALRGRIEETGQEFQQSVSVGPGETKQVALPEPVIDQPKLWWPRGCGRQDLYHLRLWFEWEGGVSDSETVTFGVRDVKRVLHERGGAHGAQFHVNGHKVLCRGGYIQPEILFEWDKQRMETEIRYFAEANLNLIYFEDIPNPPDEFLDLCDKYGILFGNCFYNCFWAQPGTNHPADLDLLSRTTEDLLKRYRNHPCLVLYMAMNEGVTREPVYTPWRRLVQELDGTRPWIPSASFPEGRSDVPEWIKPDLPAGMTDVGASYGWLEPAEYFRRVREDRRWMFMMEGGSASLPPVDSLRKFIPEAFDAPPGPHYPLSKTWAEHGANHYFRAYDEALRRIHSAPTSVPDYCRKGHLLTADQHRAMFEAVNHRMWYITSGFTQWKINACWPSVQWQIFDWYLKPMVSYYAIRRACEPLHIQWCPLDGSVAVVNHHHGATGSMIATALWYDFAMRIRAERSESVTAPGNSCREVFSLPMPVDPTPIMFLKLELRDSRGALLSDNFYWLPARPGGPQTELQKLPRVKLDCKSQFERRGEEATVRVNVRNPSDHLAFFIHVAATRGLHGEEIVPVWWSDNYFSLLPGESKSLAATFAAKDAGDGEPAIEVGGWNIQGEYECAELSAPRRPVKPGEEFPVTALIRNTFIDGSEVQLLVDGTAAARAMVYARGAKAAPARFDVKLPGPGRHEIRVGGRKAVVEARSADP